MEKIHIVCIAGPTASGKTARAIALAKEKNGEVISVDSRQVYTMLDIGTEKISTEQMQGIPHHLIDIRDPRESYSAGDFVKDATHIISAIHARGKLPILAGGTHFYFDALLRGLPDSMPHDREFRAVLEKRTCEDLFEEIHKRDPKRAKDLDPKNHRRLVRALELIDRYGLVPPRTPNTSYDVGWEFILPEREELRTRIAEREALKFPRGLIEEVRHVREYVGDTRLNELGLEYRIVGEYLRNERTEESLLPALKQKLFRYARHQVAWIRKLSDTFLH